MIKRPSSSREWKIDRTRQTEGDRINQELSIAIDESLAALARKLSILIRKQNDKMDDADRKLK